MKNIIKLRANTNENEKRKTREKINKMVLKKKQPMKLLKYKNYK